ncbi:MAG: preprotein translocase subunit YajC [Opitutales bacterium]
MQKISSESIFPLLFAQQQEGPGVLPMVLIWGLIFAAMWFLIVAPQRKKQKDLQRMVSQVTTGDEVLTSGGIYGVITNVKDDRFVLKIADSTKIEVNKSFIQSVEKKSS